MTTFRGDRTIDGLQVTVDERPLDPRFGVKTFSQNGFEWGYEGPEPQQLAFAILARHLGDESRALALSKAFMKAVIANCGNEWEMTGAEIDEALAELPDAR